MKTAHFFMQKKSGIGQTVFASILMQYIQKREIEVYGLDVGSEPGLSRYKGLNVRFLPTGDRVDADSLLHALPEGSHLVVDVAPDRVELLAGLLRPEATTKFLHVVHVGGGAGVSTAEGLDLLINPDTFGGVPCVIWMNHFFGKPVFTDTQVAQAYAIVQFPDRKRSPLFGPDFQEMLGRLETFEAAINSGEVPIMTRQRLKIFWQEICAALDLANVA
ncbi:hypothetical protein [Desulfobulbus elongatus]|uniref:hypothetical protein n=1 Tax=Desulfobulbus elongatus TaxID=53332 RepID=UPI00047F189E|nr:hypothetical protein [Desulfobulbus elongatus]